MTSDQRERWAYHEAGHAIQAHKNGLGVGSVCIEPPLVQLLRKKELERSGIDLVHPPPLDDELTEFYWKDIEVRVAGPLATLRYEVEQNRGDLSKVDPRKADLWLYGGASNREQVGDEDVARHEAEILKRNNPRLMIQEYLEYAREKVWRETIMDEAHWGALRRVAEALVDQTCLTGEECDKLIENIT